MNYVRLFLLCISSLSAAFAMEQSGQSSDWAQLVIQQLGAGRAKEFLEGKLSGVPRGNSLCFKIPGVGLNSEETWYQDLGFTVEQLVQAHQKLIEEKVKVQVGKLQSTQKAPKKRQYTEI